MFESVRLQRKSNNFNEKLFINVWICSNLKQNNITKQIQTQTNSEEWVNMNKMLKERK